MKTKSVIVAAVVMSMTSQALADRGSVLGRIGRGAPAPARIPSPNVTPSKASAVPAPLPMPQPKPLTPLVQPAPAKVAAPSPVIPPTKPLVVSPSKPSPSDLRLRGEFKKAQYPPNNGAVGKEKIVMGQPGQTFSRRGIVEGSNGTNSSKEALKGTYASPKGTLTPARALKDNPAKSKDVVFRLIKPTAYFESRIAPAFGMPGGGLQARFAKKLDTMLPTSNNAGSIKLLGHGDKGYLTEVANLRATEMSPARAHEIFKSGPADWKLVLKTPLVLR